MSQKFSLGFFPTPLHPLNGLNRLFPDYRFFIKRDDQTGLATGGNKTRKLEYLIADALKNSCDTVITAGAQQSNHCRQTASACAMAGLTCHLLLGGREPMSYSGNLLLSKLLGAHIHFTGEHRKGEDIPLLVDELKKTGSKPYVVPYGGSNLLGALGYVDAMLELKGQLHSLSVQPDYIFFATSSGGTQAGLMLGKRLYDLPVKLMPVHIDKDLPGEAALNAIVANLLREGISFFRLKDEDVEEQCHIIEGYNNAGYGVITQQEKEAIQLLAHSDGILLDPVYTGRAFSAMVDYVRKAEIEAGSTVLFWHTGGIPANFYYADHLTD